MSGKIPCRFIWWCCSTTGMWMRCVVFGIKLPIQLELRNRDKLQGWSYISSGFTFLCQMAIYWNCVCCFNLVIQESLLMGLTIVLVSPPHYYATGCTGSARWRKCFKRLLLHIYIQGAKLSRKCSFEIGPHLSDGRDTLQSLLYGWASKFGHDPLPFFIFSLLFIDEVKDNPYLKIPLLWCST